MWAIAILAAVGLLATVVTHVSTFFGLDPQEELRPLWFAFLGLFYPTMLVAVAVLHRRERIAKSQGRVLVDRASPWVERLLRVIVIYGCINIVFWFGRDFRGKGEPTRLADGTYAADPGHGRPIVPITADEYHRIHRQLACGLSGLALMFYARITVDLFLAAKQDRAAFVRVQDNQPAMRFGSEG
jgi:hypothetical protein